MYISSNKIPHLKKKKKKIALPGYILVLLAEKNRNESGLKRNWTKHGNCLEHAELFNCFHAHAKVGGSANI